MAAGSSSKLASLAQPPVLQRSGLTWIQSIAQPGRTILGPCHYNFNSGVYVIGNTRLFSKTSKTMVTGVGVELEKAAIDPEISNQESEKRSLPKTTPT